MLRRRASVEASLRTTRESEMFRLQHLDLSSLLGTSASSSTSTCERGPDQASPASILFPVFEPLTARGALPKGGNYGIRGSVGEEERKRGEGGGGYSRGEKVPKRWANAARSVHFVRPVSFLAVCVKMPLAVVAILVTVSLLLLLLTLVVINDNGYMLIQLASICAVVPFKY